MNKGQSTLQIGVAALLIITLVTGAAFMTGQPFSFTSQLCTTSMDEVTITSNVWDVSDDKAWSIRAPVGCDNKIFAGSGKIPASELSTEKYISQNGIGFGVQDFNAWFYHEIMPDSKRPVVEVRKARFDPLDVRDRVGCTGFLGVCTEQDYFNACQDWQDETETNVLEYPVSKSEMVDEGYYEDDGEPSVTCFRGEKQGVVSSFVKTSYTDFKATVKAEGQGVSDSKVITKDNTVANLQVSDVNGDGDKERARVTWLGSLLSEIRNFGFSRNYRPVCSNQFENCALPSNDISWQTTEDEDWNTYIDDVTGFKSRIESRLPYGDTGEVINEHNKESAQVLDSDSDLVLEDAGSWADKIVVKGGEVRVVAKQGQAVERPDFRFLVDADWTATSIPVGKPDFTSVPSKLNLKATETASFQVEVQNLAEAGTHRVEVSSSCPSPLSDDSQVKEISAGSTRIYQLDINSGPSSTQDVSCTLTAQDTDSTSTKDTASMQVHIESNCVDDDGDGVCNKYDQCPTTPGSTGNSGCPAEEICGDGIDNDNDGKVDEGCNTVDPPETGEGLFSSLGDFLSNPVSSVGESVNDSFERFGTILGTFDIIVSLVVGIVAFGATGNYLAPLFSPIVAQATKADESLITLVLSIIGFVLGAWLGFIVISSIIVKIVILVGLVLAFYLQIIIPESIIGV